MLGLLFAVQVGLICWLGWRPVSPSPWCLWGLEGLEAPWVAMEKERAQCLGLDACGTPKLGGARSLSQNTSFCKLCGHCNEQWEKRQPVLAGNEDLGGWIFTAENPPPWAEVHNYSRRVRIQFSWRNYSAGLRVTQQREKGNAVIINLPQESRR